MNSSENNQNLNQNANTQTQVSQQVNSQTNVQQTSSQSIPVQSNTITQQNVNVQSTPVNTTQTPPPSSEVVVVNTYKRSKGGNFILFVIIAIMFVFVFKIEDVIDYYNENLIQYNPFDKNKEENTGNLVNGYIKVNDNSSYIKIDKIKFYNFKKNNNSILYSILSYKDYSNSSKLNIVIELYNSDKDLIYKEDFILNDKIEKDAVRNISINVDENVYNDVYYALVKKKINSNESKTLTCIFENESNGVKLNYKNIYTFVNDELTEYNVHKEVQSVSEDANVSTFTSSIEKEYLQLMNFGIENTYSDNILDYKINLSSMPEGFTPLYSSKSTIGLIKKIETSKKWKCE